MEIQLTAPYLALPSTSVIPKRPMAPAAISQRIFCTRERSRRKSPSTRKNPSPRKMARNCLKRLPGALEAVTERERVERKKAMVSSSKPTQRVHRSATKYSHIKIVSPRKASTICGASSAPQAITSCTQAST